MKPIQDCHLITPGDLHWRPSNLMKMPNADFLERTGSENLCKDVILGKQSPRRRGFHGSLRTNFRSLINPVLTSRCD
jgi:hypothetical protein